MNVWLCLLYWIKFSAVWSNVYHLESQVRFSIEFAFVLGKEGIKYWKHDLTFIYMCCSMWRQKMCCSVCRFWLLSTLNIKFRTSFILWAYFFFFSPHKSNKCSFISWPNLIENCLFKYYKEYRPMSKCLVWLGVESNRLTV